MGRWFRIWQFSLTVGKCSYYVGRLFKKNPKTYLIVKCSLNRYLGPRYMLEFILERIGIFLTKANQNRGSIIQKMKIR